MFALFDGISVVFDWMRFAIRSRHSSKFVCRVKTLMLLQCLAIDNSKSFFSFWWRLVMSKWIKIRSFCSFREGLLFASMFDRAPILIRDLGS